MQMLALLRAACVVLAVSLLLSGAAGNELDDYVKAPDPNYSWTLVDTFRDPLLNTYVGYNLRLVSQRWGVGLVIPEHEIWSHYLTIIVPTNRTAPEREIGVVYMTGGNRNSPIPRPLNEVEVSLMVILTTQIGAPVAILFQCPNQSNVYLDDPEQRGRSEDTFIAWGWRKFLTEPNAHPEWLARFPMTKAGVRAMDAFSEFMEQMLQQRISKFVISGGSKRGWTAWTVAAVDDRVVGAVPLVMDLLNLRENLRHHQQMLDGWSYAFNPYYEQNVTALLDSPRLDDLSALVDPYSYIDRYVDANLPIYMVSASGDQFFMPDDSTFFRDRMGPEFRMQMMPNCEHSLILCIRSVINGISGFIDTLTLPEQSQRAEFTTFIREADGAVVFQPTTPPRAVRVWSALSAAGTGRKDFRLTRLNEAGSVIAQDVIWSSETLLPDADGNYIAQFDVVPGRWVGFWIEAEFEGASTGGSGEPQRYTSDVSIIPRTYPVPPCSGEGCRSILV